MEPSGEHDMKDIYGNELSKKVVDFLDFQKDLFYDEFQNRIYVFFKIHINGVDVEIKAS